MKLSCSTPELLQALQLVSRAIGSSQALPVLGNVLLKAAGDTCTVSATDLELSITTTVDARVEAEGAITVPAKAIVNFAQYATDAAVNLEVKEGNKLSLSSRSSKTVIAGESANEYPSIPAIEAQSTFNLPVTGLLKALHHVTFASAKTSLRPVLSGVSIRTSEGKMVFVATDSYRLSEYKIPVEGVSDVACIIPAKVLEEVRAALGSKDKEKKDPQADTPDAPLPGVMVALSKQQVEFTVGRTRLLSRLIEGKFPDYNQIIPKEPKTRVALTVKELLPSVRRMHYFAKEVNNKLTFACNREQTTIVTPQTQAGRDETTLMAELSGDENKIALSSSYLLDFLGHVDTDVVTMQVTDSQRPAVFTQANEPDFLHLIMPLRMTEE